VQSLPGSCGKIISEKPTFQERHWNRVESEMEYFVGATQHDARPPQP
jgi:hypothetical protein